MSRIDAVADRSVFTRLKFFALKLWRCCRAILGASRQAVSSWHERERRRAALKGLDDWILKDIGITRGGALRRLEQPPETIDTTKRES